MVGLLSAMAAYLTWGLTPVYFKALINVPPFGIGFDFGDLPTNFAQVTGIYIFRE